MCFRKGNNWFKITKARDHCLSFFKRMRDLTVSNAYIYLYSEMHATIYGRGQMVIPAKARKEAGFHTGDVVSVQPDGDGRLVLVRLEKPKSKPVKAKIINRKGKHPVGDIGRTITLEEINNALNEFP